ncbi:hypothetical protein AB0B89_33335, partial [Sphaerisporangium sp. NPDC049002]|uniref:hypothetical protein n=1 Tax=Sphaerisporangium sp. NPDC049002 TaxID=3155392 RepID=UPI003403DDE0
LSMMTRSPVRTRAWSSAMTTRSVEVSSARAPEHDADGHARLARPLVDAFSPVREGGLGHVTLPDRLW